MLSRRALLFGGTALVATAGGATALSLLDVRHAIANVVTSSLGREHLVEGAADRFAAEYGPSFARRVKASFLVTLNQKVPWALPRMHKTRADLIEREILSVFVASSDIMPDASYRGSKLDFVSLVTVPTCSMFARQLQQ